MSDSAERSAGSDRTHLLRKRIAQLEAEVRALRKQVQAQRKRIAQKCGYEFVSLVDSEVNCKVVVIDIVQKLVFQDEEGNVVSQTDGSLVGKIIEVRFNSVH
ncbi:hypothetical protein [Chlorogloea sp. CCALA 695]|uniref:hypothetical protein n=1 Tax=Chlorogloea sp. CCALA 695 TaxID=2107693 RepID=UPI000D07EB98|nr:hypothetical protein [Chlorogloea sp. CCALA 695]PSB28751.1 hypothetical protein C7B70_20320 [Chlorogloea sp. CCALA 695]